MCNPSATLKFAIPALISDKTPAPTVQCWDVSGILGTDLILKFAQKKKWCAPNTFPIDRTHRRNMPFEIQTSHFSSAPSLDSGGGFFDTIPNCKWNVAWGFVKHDNVITFFCTRLISAKNVFLFFFSCLIRRGSSIIPNKHPPFENSKCKKQKRRIRWSTYANGPSVRADWDSAFNSSYRRSIRHFKIGNARMENDACFLSHPTWQHYHSE